MKLILFKEDIMSKLALEHNIIIRDGSGKIIYEGHNTDTYAGANMLIHLVAGDYASTVDKGVIKYLLFGDQKTNAASSSDTAMDTSLSSLKIYQIATTDDITYTPASSSSPASATFKFVIPQADVFNYNELGLAGQAGAGQLTNSTTDNPPYFLVARHTYDTLQSKDNSTDITVEWTISASLATI
jgi:hypothetical protein